jgi:hypothetical protein
MTNDKRPVICSPDELPDFADDREVAEFLDTHELAGSFFEGPDPTTPEEHAELARLREKRRAAKERAKTR